MGTVTPEQMLNTLPCIKNRFQVDLATVLWNFSLQCSITKFEDGGEALACIFHKENVNSKMLSNLNNKKKLFYSDIATNTFRKKFDLHLIDISFLFEILTKISCFPTCLKKLTKNCCQTPSQQVASKERCCEKCREKCQHVCKSCKKLSCECRNPSWDHECKYCSKTISFCLKLVCKICEGKPLNEQCGFDRFIRALKFIHKYRNFVSHTTIETCNKFIVGQHEWEDYPNIRNWLDLYVKVIEYYNYLLNFMCNGNAFKQPLLLHLKEEKLFSMKKLMEDLWVTPELLVNSRCYRRREIYKKSPLHLEMLCDQEYCFTLPEHIHHILKIEIIKDQNTEEIPDDSYTFFSSGDSTILSIKDRNFSGNCFFTLKLEYEMLEDCNDVIWVASSDLIEADIYKTSMISFQEDNGKTNHVSSDGNLVEKMEIVVEKQNLGICALFPKEGINNVLVVQLKNSADKQWNCHSYESLREAKECFILSLSGLEREQNYDIRILCTKQSDGLQQFVLLQVFNEEVLDYSDFMHVMYDPKNNFGVFSRSHGNQSHPHTVDYKDLPKMESIHLYVQRGRRHTKYTLCELLHYLPTNFGEQNVIIFPPTFNTFITLLQNSFLQMKKEFCVILPNFNFSKAMDFMGMDCTQFGLNSKTFDNGFLILDLDHHLILSLRICNGNTINDIRTSMELTHADTKALILLCKDFIGERHLTLYGTIAFPGFSNRAELNDVLFCELCKSELKFLTAEDLQDVEHLSKCWQRILEDVETMNGDFSTNREWFSQISSYLMVIIARERSDVPELEVRY